MADSKFDCPQDAKDKVTIFEQADTIFKSAWEAFEQAHATEIEQLEKLRDDRNAKLDEAKRSLRQVVDNLDEMRLTFRQGKFEVQKKWSDFYIPEKLVAMLTDHGLYDTAVSAGVITIKVETAKYAIVKAFLEANKIEKEFECCEDGVEDGSAIKGPKPVPVFGAELKKE